MVDVIIFYFGLFCPFTSLTTWKMKISKKWREKKHLKISFYTSVPKIMIICYTIPETWYMKDVIIFYFGLFFALLPSNSPKKQTFKKVKTKCLDISSFYSCAAKIMIRRCTVSSAPKKINISHRVQLYLGWKKRHCKPNSLIQTFVYRSNIYNSKTDQSGHWKNNSPTLHLD